MKFLAILLTVCCLHAYSGGVAQEKINVTVKDVGIKQALAAIQNVTSYRFFYNDDILPSEVRVTVKAKDALLSDVLHEIFQATFLTYKLLDNNIVVITKVNAVEVAFPVRGVVQLRDNYNNLSNDAGVVVTEVGTTNSTVTNDAGEFTISVTDGNATLEFSHVGYRTQQVKLSGRNTVDVALVAEVSQLEGVVVTALGISRKRKTLTYAAQELKGTELSNSREVNISSALTGKVAGLTINKTNSGPGASNRIIFRGNRSIGSSNQPLIVVDGVRIDNDSKAAADVALFGARDNGDGISNINPDDVESMTVLTGASASALYGSDAANGVILITTKKGRTNKGIGIQLSSSFAIEKPMLFPDFQNEYGQGSAGLFSANSDNSWGPRMTGQNVEDWTGKQQALTPQPDNYKDFFRTGTESINALSISTGNEKAQTYFSYTNTFSKGILPNNDYKRHNLNLRETVRLTNKLTMDVKANYISEKILNRPLSGAGNRMVSTLYAMPRSLRLSDIANFEFQDADGELNQNYWGLPSPSYQNPYWSAYRNLHDRKRDRLIGLLSFEYQFTPELSLLARTSLDYYFDKSEEKNYNGTYWLTDYPGQGNYILSKESNRQFNNDVLLTYNKNLSADFSLTVNAGASIEQFHFERTTQNTQGLSAPNIFAVSNAVSLSSEVFPYLPYFPIARKEKQAVYGAAQLGYKNALFLDLTGRNDWNSTLSPEHASYFFPSAGVSAVLSDLLQLPAPVSFLKARASYAFVGNGTGFNQIKPSYALVPGGNGGFVLVDRTLRKYDLKPEQTRSFEAGLEFALFNDRLGANLTYYKTNTINQILSIPIPEPSGYSTRIINAGNIRNAGVELLLNATPVLAGEFRWNVNVNFGSNRNRVLELDSLQPKVFLSSPQSWGSLVVEEGKRFGEIYTSSLRRSDDGEIIVDENGLPLLETEQSNYVGNANPDWTGGINNTFIYKNWSLSFLIDARQGGVIVSGTQGFMAMKGTSAQTLEGREGGFVVPNSVREDGSKNTTPVSAQDYWSTVAGNSIGELFAYDASNVRLREAIVSYRLPARLLNRSFIKGANVSFVGRNLFFLKNNAKGIDPESSLGTGNNQGIEYASLPSTRSYCLHLRFNF
jgi:TonB-linked SusC/RagA family outer membrane protein